MPEELARDLESEAERLQLTKSEVARRRLSAPLQQPDEGSGFNLIADLLDKYADVPMSLADAGLVRLTEIMPDSLLLTVGSDFKIYRRLGRRVVPTRMP